MTGRNVSTEEREASQALPAGWTPNSDRLMPLPITHQLLRTRTQRALVCKVHTFSLALGEQLFKCTATLPKCLSANTSFTSRRGLS